MIRSALYRGHLVHVRRDQHARQFRYPIVTAHLDLDELPALHRALRLFSHNRANLWSLHDVDYDDAGRGLVAGYHARLAEAGLPRPARARLVTQLRTANYVFNPVSFFLGYDPAGALQSVIADVRNNYGGRHRYALGPAERAPAGPGRARFVVDRTFFVSPFLHGDARYQFEFDAGPPDGDGLDVRMDVDRPDGARVFVAHLRGARVALDDRALVRAAVRYPLMSVQVIALIYGEAVWNHLRGVPFRRPAPDHRPAPL
ncbi:MAG: DUF1365 domain-containing protein [Myxococcales bacterium]|nr:DUF1365 domain-containing protein [Myxococcales bacterium]